MNIIILCLIKAGPLEMGAFLCAKALKTENVNFLLYYIFAPCINSIHMIMGCTLSDINCMCDIKFGLQALFLHADASCARL